MTEKLKAVLDNARDSKTHKKVDRDKVRMMSRERMERTDKVVRMRSAYNERPSTGQKRRM